LHELLRSGLTGTSAATAAVLDLPWQMPDRNLCAYFPFVDQQLISHKIGLRPYIVCLGLLQLGMAAVSCRSAAMIPALAFSMSDAVNPQLARSGSWK